MKKNLLLGLLLFFLIVMNGVLLFMLFQKGPYGRPHKPPGDFIVKELNLNTDQLQKFNALRRTHYQEMRRLDHEMRGLKDQLFNGIGQEDFTPQKLDSITTLIAALSKQRESNMYHHFKAVSEVCTPEQRIKLNHIIAKAMRKHGPPGRRP